MSTKKKLEISPEISLSIVQCINDAVGDRIKEDVKRHRLVTQNSTPSRIWDLLNTDLCTKFNSPDCMAYKSKRGPWEMVMVYEKCSGFLYSIMREKRYKEVYNKIRHRRRMHYVDILARHLNSDLISTTRQLSFIPTIPVTFEDQDKVVEAVQKLLENLLEDNVVLKRHVLVLFEGANFQLSSVRAVMVNSNLDIVAEEDWSKYISIEESIIVDQVEDANIPFNNPTRGLKLTAKADKRKRSAQIRKIKKENEPM